MELSILDFILINFVSYVFGIGTGLVICLKNKDKLLVKSRSNDNLSLRQFQQNNNQSHYDPPPPPIIAASAPPPDKVPIKITVE